ncbi:MAG TPA: anthranilate phosphoribosyltransferase, partial [candidate division Zixibacteria bacterium]|nr:anthranilate phosphoribosyltransferase [candidate division Zixibacteria bacterium]
PTDYVEFRDGEKHSLSITPLEVGLKTHPTESLKGADAEANVKILRGIFDGDHNSCREAVLFNAGALIYVSGKVETIWDGVSMARDAVDWGAARKKLHEWVEFGKAVI